MQRNGDQVSPLFPTFKVLTGLYDPDVQNSAKNPILDQILKNWTQMNGMNVQKEFHALLFQSGHFGPWVSVPK